VFCIRRRILTIILNNYEVGGEEMEVDDKRDLFPKKRVERIHEAIAKNKPKMGDIYYHPAYSRMVPKCIDLSCQRPLHAAGSAHFKEPEPEKLEEKWLEAYLIQQAKKNGWILELCGKEYQFLFSQLNFKSEGNGIPARPLDLLLYDPDACCLVVLELKVIRQLIRAKEELKYYTGKVRECQGRIADVFRLGEVRYVVGYIVWPGSERSRDDKHEFGKYGVMEYKPWNSLEVPIIEFTEKHPPTLEPSIYGLKAAN